jgi:hypothetical protein
MPSTFLFVRFLPKPRKSPCPVAIPDRGLIASRNGLATIYAKSSSATSATGSTSEVMRSFSRRRLSMMNSWLIAIN